MRLLLDTHAFLWWLTNDSTLSGRARAVITNAESMVFVSAATVWEMAIKQNVGKLAVPADLDVQIERHHFEPLFITFAHASLAGALPRHHDDPFDRMLVAQASLDELTIVTRDPRIARYDVPTLEA